MRIISQDGKFDINYDNAGIECCEAKGGAFEIEVVTQQRTYPFFARYSSKKKALKAIGKLKEAYMDYEYYLRVVPGGVNVSVEEQEEMEYLDKLLKVARESCLFQFPRDEDLED